MPGGGSRQVSMQPNANMMAGQMMYPQPQQQMQQMQHMQPQQHMQSQMMYPQQQLVHTMQGQQGQC